MDQAQLTQPDIQKVQQMQGQKALRGTQAGLKLFETDNVNVPIKLTEGLADLKWLLNAIISGQFAINMDPQGVDTAVDTNKS